MEQQIHKIHKVKYRDGMHRAMAFKFRLLLIPELIECEEQIGGAIVVVHD